MDYIKEYCRARTSRTSNKLPIRDDIDLPLKTIIFMITQVVGSIKPHLDSKGNIEYALACLEPMIFNWCLGMLFNMKD
jgi:hypothetical protein